MKAIFNSFGAKLWRYFVLFAAVIFIVLWLLQTVFLQSFYSQMAISHLKKAVSALAAQKDDEAFLSAIDETAYENAMLIFLLDGDGNVLYSADEYSTLYNDRRSRNAHGGENPYLSSTETANWEKGVIRNLSRSHEALVAQLAASDADSLGLGAEDGSSYLYGVKLGESAALDGENLILCAGAPLSEVGSTAQILRIQLIWVSVLSLVFAFVLAFFLSKKFGRPIDSIAKQAQKMAHGDFQITFDKGFCTELDGLADTLSESAAALDRLETARRDFLASISHDLRTPLTMIKGYAELVREISWSDEPKRNHDLSVIGREADRLTALVNEILEYSAMKSDGCRMEIAPLNLSETVETVLSRFEAVCAQSGCTVETSIAPEVTIKADTKQLARVLYNFMDNAVSHADGTHKIEVVLAQTGGKARLSVRNCGQPIDEAELPYVWDKYYTSRSRKNKETVSGLGLAIAKEILTAHGAAFGVKNEDGCVFWFELPAE